MKKHDLKLLFYFPYFMCVWGTVGGGGVCLGGIGENQPRPPHLPGKVHCHSSTLIILDRLFLSILVVFSIAFLNTNNQKQLRKKGFILA